MIEKKLAILERFLGNYFATNRREGTEYLFRCLFCDSNKRKLSVNLDKNVWKCWVCGTAGHNISSLVFKFGDSNSKTEWENIFGRIDFSINREGVEDDLKEIVYLPKEFETLTNNIKSPFVVKAKQYLFNRGISFDDVLWWKMGYCARGVYEGRIVIPSFNTEGKVDFFIARSYINHKMSYLNPAVSKDIVFNHLYIDKRKPLTIVEGVFDAIKADNAVPLLGSLLNENSILFDFVVNHEKEVYLALDKDARSKQNKILKNILQYREDVFCIDVFPWKDVGEMSKEEFQDKKRNAVKVDNGNMIEYLMKAENCK